MNRTRLLRRAFLTSMLCPLALSFTFTGCGTLVSRYHGISESGWQAQAYSGVQRDSIGILTGSYAKVLDSNARAVSESKASVWTSIFAAVDLPFSFILDTTLLPVDLITWAVSDPAE